MPDLSVGARVCHAEHGEGLITSLQRGGRAAMVRFPRFGRMEMHVPARELILLSPPRAAPTAASTATPTATKATKAKKAAATVSGGTGQLIEALRLGVVPSGGLELYTVGREREVALIQADLAATKAGVGAARVVLGDYGSGKTHLLEHIGARARAEGFLVATASLDPVDSPASNPRRVYRALMQGLAHPGDESERGLAPLLERARGHEVVKQRFLQDDGPRHAYLTPALSLLNRIDEADAPDVLDWLSGAAQDYTPELNARFSLYGKRTLPALMDYRPWAHIYAYLLSGLASLAQATGSAGLVLLLDEAEFFRVLSSENREFAERLFRALVAASLPANELPFSPEREPRGGRGDFKTLPCRFEANCPLYVVLAMTPTGQGDKLIESLLPEARRTELSILGADEYRELARRVVTLYAGKYEALAPKVGPLSELIGDLMFKGLRDGSFPSPRMAVKFVLELLDMSRLSPEHVKTALEELKRLWY